MTAHETVEYGVTPEGREVILTNTVIDSTGSADIAIAAGASYVYRKRVYSCTITD